MSDREADAGRVGTAVMDTAPAIFTRQMFDEALALGVGLPFRPRRCFHHVMVGASTSPMSGLTAVVAAIIRPDGRRQIIDVRSVIFGESMLAHQLDEFSMRYGASTARSLPEGRKYDDAAARLADSMRESAWLFPCHHEELIGMISEAIEYMPSRPFGQSLMAWCILNESIGDVG